MSNPEEVIEQEDTSAEDKARAMGWKPEEEYKGPKEKWVPAEEFVKRAEEDPHEVRKANHVLMRKVQKLEQGIDDILSHQQRELTRARQEEYARAQSDLKRAHDAAIAEGDVEKASKTADAREALARQQVEESRKSAPSVASDDASILTEWKSENDWYGKNYRATKEANEYEDFLAKQGVPLEDRLRQTAEFIKAEILKTAPVARQRDDAPAPIIGQNNNGAIRGNRKPKPGSYEALTSAARAECDRVIRTSGGKVTKEMWLSHATDELFVQQ